MNTILILFLFFIVSMFLMMIGAIFFINFFVRKYIGEKHIVLEELTSGKVPQQWSEKYNQKCQKFIKNGQQEKVEKLKKEAAKAYRKKLDHIVSYVKKTKLVESESARSIILSDLEKTRNRWKEENAHEF